MILFLHLLYRGHIAQYMIVQDWCQDYWGPDQIPAQKSPSKNNYYLFNSENFYFLTDLNQSTIKCILEACVLKDAANFTGVDNISRDAVMSKTASS